VQTVDNWQQEKGRVRVHRKELPWQLKHRNVEKRSAPKAAVGTSHAFRLQLNAKM
jgi:hypothetical protein